MRRRRRRGPTARSRAYKEQRDLERAAGTAPIHAEGPQWLDLTWTELHALDELLVQQLVVLNAGFVNRDSVVRRRGMRAIEKRVSTYLYGATKRNGQVKQTTAPVTLMKPDGSHEVRFTLTFWELTLLDEVFAESKDAGEVVESIATKIHHRLVRAAEDGLAREGSASVV